MELCEDKSDIPSPNISSSVSLQESVVAANNECGTLDGQVQEGHQHLQDNASMEWSCGVEMQDRKFSFTNRKRSSSSIKLSSDSLNKLAQGKELLFYHPSSCSMLKVRAFSSKNFILQETPRDIESRKAEVSTVISSSSRDAKENCLCLENHSLRSGKIAEFANPDVSSNLKSCIESETSDEAAVIFHQQRQVEGRVFVFSARTGIQFVGQ